MRQRKRQRKDESPETLAKKIEEDERLGDGDDGGGESKSGFFACYLLVSLSPRHKGHTYIGFTVNPRRRIRQHNGEIGCGAWRTKKRRPWEMVLCIHGFPSNVSALQFEWAWQHPNESLAVRKAAASFKSLSGVANKIKLAYTMLTLPSWQSLNMTVNYFSTKYVKHSAGCPSLPEHMKVRVRPMDELPCYVEGGEGSLEGGDEWDREEWGEEDCSVGKSYEETSSSSVSGNSKEEHDKCSVGEIHDDNGVYEWSVGGEDRREECSFSESPERPSSSKVDSSLFVEDIVEETGLFRLIDDDPFGLEAPSRERFTAPIDLDDKQAPRERFVMPDEVEVIDVTTPSPVCGTSLWGKKRRVSTACPEIIDLTKSPVFV